MGKKTFYTERDIEDLSTQGITQLTIHDDVVLTDLAREKANRLGLKLITSQLLPQNHQSSLIQANPDDLHLRIKKAVLARLDNQVPELLVEAIIAKVLAKLNLTS